jgi:hypothetical protein
MLALQMPQIARGSGEVSSPLLRERENRSLMFRTTATMTPPPRSIAHHGFVPRGVCRCRSTLADAQHSILRT